MKKLVIGITALAFAVIAGAQQKLVIATGNAKTGSTYHEMVTNLDKYCGKGNLQLQPTNGGVENRDLLIGNKVHIAPMQADMLEFTRRNDPSKVTALRTLIPLHDEEVHLVAYAGKRKEGGVMGFGAKTVEFKDISSLAGRKVGAVGGSFDSASVIASVSGVAYTVVRYDNDQAMVKALEEGAVDAVFIVAGAPSKIVGSLTRNFRLLPIPKESQAKLVSSKLYSPAVLSYTNLNAVGIATVSTRSLLVTRDYRGAAMQTKLRDLRACFKENLTSLSEDIGNHAKWGSVKDEKYMGWPTYE